MKSDFMKIRIEDVRVTGSNLIRPKGVMAADDGIIYATDARGCCSRLPQRYYFVFRNIGRNAERNLSRQERKLHYRQYRQWGSSIIIAGRQSKVLLDGDQGSRMYIAQLSLS